MLRTRSQLRPISTHTLAGRWRELSPHGRTRLGLACLFAVGLVCLLGFLSGAETQGFDPANYETLKAQAEKHYAQGSYALAHELYRRADEWELPLAEARWVDFRVADTRWRSQAATDTADSSLYDQARQQLEGVIAAIERVEDRDLVWAEAQESLGDFWWIRRTVRNWSQAWSHYQQALDWWAGSAEIELARQRYLRLVWTMAEPPQVEPYYTYGTYGNQLPLEILKNALELAENENEQARAHYLIAMTLRHQGDWVDRQRVPEEFDAALRLGAKTEWYDDALYHYAEWLANTGPVIALEDGQWRQEPDYGGALKLFRRLLGQYRKGETRYYDPATHQIEQITKPIVGVSVSHAFLPGSEIQFLLNWRNVKRVHLALYQVNLTRDLDFSTQDNNSLHLWLDRIRVTEAARVKSWAEETQDQGDYKPGQDSLRLDGTLAPGAYLLEAQAAGERARDLILVSDATLVVKASGRQALVYFCNALDGSPIPRATVRLWEPLYQKHKWVIRASSGQTNEEGIAVFPLASTQHYRQLFTSAAQKDRQAFSAGYGYGLSKEEEVWRIYAFTDRPAYRPGETAQWKLVARQWNGAAYSTPAYQTLWFEITDPRGSKVQDGTLTLNAFGSGWGALELSDSMPLGEYRIAFWEGRRERQRGAAQLFRLEEYKLPEFKVSIQTPTQNGKKKAFRLGETVAVSIEAEYYFGGPVPNATVEVLVYQRPFYHSWQRPRPFPWFYEDLSPSGRHYGGERGQLLRRETLKTDAHGTATLRFETPRTAQQDFEYQIEARVRDASRREIISNDTVWVTRQRYYVYPHARHNLYQPQDKVTIEIKALDANQQPVEAEGKITVTRDTWYEIWIDPEGREVRGRELDQLRREGKRFPPAPEQGQKPWRLKFRGYQHDTLFTRSVKTTAEGEAEFSFTPERDGYYRIAWSSQEKGSAPIRAETTVWVTRGDTTELGYRHGGLEIIIDKDTFRAGDRAPVLLHAPTHDRYVLFSIEGEDLYSYQLVHLTGTVKLLEVPVEAHHVPNLFLSAAMVSDRQLFVDVKPVVVPPVEHFLTVDLQADRTDYQPREDGSLTVTTRDHTGRPVAAEVALGLVDESVYYIQQDYAGDPRQFYFGRKRPLLVQIQSTFQQKGYTRLVEGKDQELIDEFQLGALAGGDAGARRDPWRRSVVTTESRGVADGVFGGVIGYAANAKMADASMREERATQEPTPASRPSPTEPAAQVRSDFRATVLWQPSVVTDKNGRAVVKVRYPDSLTTWKATARVGTHGSQFGLATTSTRTQKPLLVRLQAPRFFVVGDSVTLSAVINNNTEEALTVTPSLRADGVVVTGLLTGGRLLKGEPEPRAVPARGEVRVDWVVNVERAGAAKLRVTAQSPTHADAMEKTYPIYEHGIEKLLAKAGKLRGDDISIRLDLPTERKPESTRLAVQITPSLAVTMLDALPYLIDYPYGCTEQTMSRFLPAVITAKTLTDLGLEPEAVMGKIFGGLEPRSARSTHPRDAQDLRQLDAMVRQGLERLTNFQHSDGGWGWWKEGESDPFMTAYVVWGLTLAAQAGIEVNTEVLERGVVYLDQELVEQELNYDQQAWMLHALAAYHSAAQKDRLTPFQAKAFENLWSNRDKLNAYTRSLLALSAHQFGLRKQAQLLVENLGNGVKIDRSPDTSVLDRGSAGSNPGVLATAHWGEDGIYRRWSDGGVEATAFALRALLAIDPQNSLVEPVTHWLLKNRRGAQWSSTRDTAIVVLALNDYLRASGELAAELTYELRVNGTLIAANKVTPADIGSAPSLFPIDSSLIRDGANEIRIRRKSGSGPIYFAVQASFFSWEEPIPAAGHEIFVRRQYYKLVGRPTLLKGTLDEKLPLEDGGRVRSGERVEVVVRIEAKNHYEYLVFEDLKPAGFEAVAVRSGEPLYARELKASAVHRLFAGPVEVGRRTLASLVKPSPTPQASDTTDYTGRSRWVHQELRDRKVALFLDKLPEGVWELRYQLRAEVPGEFHALPLLGHAMYVPEIRANGTETRLTIEEGDEGN